MSGVSVDNAATSYSASSSGRIAHGAAIVITERLAELPDIALPSSLYKEAARPPATAEILAYLQALLQKDPAAFLARYGGVLQSQELNHFEALRSGDYEVDHWLSHFAAERMDAAAHAANPRRLPAKVKNRRLAAMRRLAAQGEYFSDEAMRERAPLLYHQQIGQFVKEQQQMEEPHQDQDQAQFHPSNGERTGQRQAQTQAAGPSTCGQRDAGTSGGLGASCLAGALRAALEAHDARLPTDGSGNASGPVRGATGSAPATSCGAPDPRPPGGAAGRPDGSHMRAWQQQNGGVCTAGDRVLDADGAEGQARMFVGAGTHTAAANDAAASAPGCRTQRAGAAADMLFSEFLMRQDDEAQLVMRRIHEQQEEDAQMSEHESDEEDDEEEEEGEEVVTTADDGRRAGGQSAVCRRRRSRTSAKEQAHMRRDFVSEMQSRFLLGQDSQYVDYSVIDADASLDGDWLEEEARDAEEKYFDED